MWYMVLYQIMNQVYFSQKQSMPIVSVHFKKRQILFTIVDEKCVLSYRLSPEVAQKALSPVEIGEILQSKMADTMDVSASAPAFSGNAIVPNMRSGSACGHNNSGQELCYLCHQRDRRNIPVNFTEERRRREQEEDRLLQQYQQMKDTEAILTEQVCMIHPALNPYVAGG